MQNNKRNSMLVLLVCQWLSLAAETQSAATTTISSIRGGGGGSSSSAAAAADHSSSVFWQTPSRALASGVSQQCVAGTNEMMADDSKKKKKNKGSTEVNTFQKALKQVIHDIELTDEACQRWQDLQQSQPGGQKEEKEPNDIQEGGVMEEGKPDSAAVVLPKGMVCVVDETHWASSQAYVDTCLEAGGFIHSSNFVISCSTPHDPKGSSGNSAQEETTSTEKESNQAGGEMMSDNAVFEYHYKNMKFCFDPVSCTETDMEKAIQQEANTFLTKLEEENLQSETPFYQHSSNTLSVTNQDEFKLTCQAQVSTVGVQTKKEKTNEGKTGEEKTSDGDKKEDDGEEDEDDEDLDDTTNATSTADNETLTEEEQLEEEEAPKKSRPIQALSFGSVVLFLATILLITVAFFFW